MTSACAKRAVVIGAGPAGLTAALALAAAGADVVIAAPSPRPAPSEADPRTTALLASSLELLKNLRCWDRTCASASAILEGVRIVDDRGGLLRAPEVLFRASELGLASFGVNIANATLNAALSAAVESTERLRWRPTSAVVKVEPGQSSVRIVLAEGDTLDAALAVAADGRNSMTRVAGGIATRAWNYGQSAIVTTFRHSRPHGAITTELHRRAGPLTTVPLPGDASSLVWVEEPKEANRLAALENHAFLAALAACLQGFLGSLGEASARTLFPLTGLSAAPMGHNRIALVGESAHVVPPIGAQGLNLGLRDAAALADCVADALGKGEDIGGPETLQAYAAARAADVLARTVSIDLLNRSLLLDYLPVQALRGLGLHALANVGPLRRLAMRGGLAGAGPLPRLMRPGAMP
jgi:2-octaprenyl-6-methoxyphenol hydroxylase